MYRRIPELSPFAHLDTASCTYFHPLWCSSAFALHAWLTGTIVDLEKSGP